MKDLGKKIKGICSSCKKESQFTYQGEQKIPGDKSIPIYNCEECNSTVSLNSIKNRENLSG